MPTQVRRVESVPGAPRCTFLPAAVCCSKKPVTVSELVNSEGGAATHRAVPRGGNQHRGGLVHAQAGHRVAGRGGYGQVHLLQHRPGVIHCDRSINTESSSLSFFLR
jgi:hypothetical protein